MAFVDADIVVGSHIRIDAILHNHARIVNQHAVCANRRLRVGLAGYETVAGDLMVNVVYAVIHQTLYLPQTVHAVLCAVIYEGVVCFAGDRKRALLNGQGRIRGALIPFHEVVAGNAHPDGIRARVGMFGQQPVRAHCGIGRAAVGRVLYHIRRSTGSDHLIGQPMRQRVVGKRIIGDADGQARLCRIDGHRPVTGHEAVVGRQPRGHHGVGPAKRVVAGRGMRCVGERYRYIVRANQSAGSGQVPRVVGCRLLGRVLSRCFFRTIVGEGCVARRDRYRPRCNRYARRAGHIGVVSVNTDALHIDQLIHHVGKHKAGLVHRIGRRAIVPGEPVQVDIALAFLNALESHAMRLRIIDADIILQAQRKNSRPADGNGTLYIGDVVVIQYGDCTLQDGGQAFRERDRRFVTYVGAHVVVQVGGERMQVEQTAVVGKRTRAVVLGYRVGITRGMRLLVIEYINRIRRKGNRPLRDPYGRLRGSDFVVVIRGGNRYVGGARIGEAVGDHLVVPPELDTTQDSRFVSSGCRRPDRQAYDQ